MRESSRKLSRWLTIATIVTVSVWIGLVVNRAWQRHNANIAIRELRSESLSPGSRFGHAGLFTSFGSRIAIRRARELEGSPFEPRGPEWLRTWLGEEWCQEWIDNRVAVSLSHTAAEDTDVALLRCFPEVKRVDLTRTRITDSGLSHLRNLTELEELRLAGNVITDAGLEQLKGLSRLRVLDVWESSITDEGIEKLKQFPHLRELHLSSKQITDAGLEALAGMHQLEMLRVGSQHLTEKRP